MAWASGRGGEVTVRLDLMSRRGMERAPGKLIEQTPNDRSH
jgi:hypothetical protein